jgi:hypothetical protein
MIPIMLPISPMYVERAVITPIMKGKCGDAKNNIEKIRKIITEIREYFLFEKGEFIGLVKEGYAPRIAKCLGGTLHLDAIYILESDERNAPNSPMRVTLQSLDDIDEFDKWITSQSEIPFIPVDMKDEVKFSDLKSNIFNVPKVSKKNNIQKSAGYHYDYVYPENEDIIFRISAESVVPSILSVEEIKEYLRKIREKYPPNVEISYGVVVGFTNICPFVKPRTPQYSQYM